MGVWIQSFGLVHYWNGKAIHGSWRWTSRTCGVSWTVALSRFMPRLNISASQWPTFCGSNSFPFQHLPRVVWTAAISVSSLPVIPVYLRISSNELLASPLSPKRWFSYEGSGGQWWYTYQIWPLCNEEIPTLAAAQPACPSLARSPLLYGHQPGRYNNQDPQEVFSC